MWQTNLHVKVFGLSHSVDSVSLIAVTCPCFGFFVPFLFVARFRPFPSFECKRKTFVIISILVWLTLVYTLIQIDSLFYIFFWHFFLSFFSFGMIKVISKISERLNEFGCSLPLSYRSKLKGCGVNKESMGWKEMQSKENTSQHGTTTKKYDVRKPIFSRTPMSLSRTITDLPTIPDRRFYGKIVKKKSLCERLSE